MLWTNFPSLFGVFVISSISRQTKFFQHSPIYIMKPCLFCNAMFFIIWVYELQIWSDKRSAGRQFYMWMKLDCQKIVKNVIIKLIELNVSTMSHASNIYFGWSERNKVAEKNTIRLRDLSYIARATGKVIENASERVKKEKIKRMRDREW